MGELDAMRAENARLAARLNQLEEDEKRRGEEAQQPPPQQKATPGDGGGAASSEPSPSAGAGAAEGAAEAELRGRLAHRDEELAAARLQIAGLQREIEQQFSG